MIFSGNKIIKHTLALGFALIIILFISFGIITLEGMSTIGNLTKTIYEHPLVVSNASLNAALNVAKMHRSMKDVVLTTSLIEIDTDLKTVAEYEQTVYQQLDAIRDNILGDEGKELEKETRKLFMAWEPIRQEVIRLLKSGNKIEAITITRAKGADHVAKLEAKMKALSSYARNKATGFLNLAETSYSHLEKVTIVLTSAGLLLSAVIAIVASYRIIKAETVLLEEKNNLQGALNEIKILRGIIPICSHCKKIRNDDGIWQKIEKYFDEHSEAKFSHGICPDCMTKYYPED